VTARVPLGHVVALTDDHGVFEHAKGDVPRRAHGYCLDDNARALIVAAREDADSPAAARLADRYLHFVDAAIARDGRARNRMDAAGLWTDLYDVGDWWGRAVWGLGVAATTSSSRERRFRARTVFHRATRTTSPYLRSMAFAAIGAADVLLDDEDASARRLLHRWVAMISPMTSELWAWPEDRMRYANGAIPDALIAAGSALHDEALVRRGLVLLELLLRVDSRDGHLSVTPASGRGPDDRPPAFDQQPIEVAAIAEACARAFTVTGDRRWVDAVSQAWAWFEGQNDVGVMMFDPETGAGFDGLTETGRNENRGAESTLAALSTLQCALRCGAASVAAARVGGPGQVRSGSGGISESPPSDHVPEP
jgi:hypothetical protein